MATIILAIESSCDETSASICKDGVILSNIIANQTVHEQYGGVVPELASRAHMQNIVPVVDKALKAAGCTMQELSAIAFTQAPGLIGSLLVGAQFAKSLSLALNIPLIAVHHMQAHVIANLIPVAVTGTTPASQSTAPTAVVSATGNSSQTTGPTDTTPEYAPRPSFPFLCLTVSGGHTQIVLCESPLKMSVIGETMDDAAGEAFDKSAKILGLPYPGGPLIDKYAREGNPKAYAFPEPQIPELNFSFSGLKTAILYFLQDNKAADPAFVEKNLPDICASIQHRIVTILLNKVKKAMVQTGIKDICIAGGVSANSGLRNALKEWGVKYKWNTFIPPFQYCTDNAGMIAMTAYYKYLAGAFTDLHVSPSARAEWA